MKTRISSLLLVACMLCLSSACMGWEYEDKSQTNMKNWFSDIEENWTKRNNDACTNAAEADELTYAEQLFVRGDYEEAILVLEQVLQAQPRDARVYSALAEAYKASGDKEKAIAALQKGIERTAENHTLYLSLAELYMEKEAYKDAAALLRSGLQQHPGSNDLIAALYNAKCAVNKHVNWRAIYREFLEEDIRYRLLSDPEETNTDPGYCYALEDMNFDGVPELLAVDQDSGRAGDIYIKVYIVESGQAVMLGEFSYGHTMFGEYLLECCQNIETGDMLYVNRGSHGASCDHYIQTEEIGTLLSDKLYIEDRFWEETAMNVYPKPQGVEPEARGEDDEPYFYFYDGESISLAEYDAAYADYAEKMRPVGRIIQWISSSAPSQYSDDLYGSLNTLECIELAQPENIRAAVDAILATYRPYIFVSDNATTDEVITQYLNAGQKYAALSEVRKAIYSAGGTDTEEGKQLLKKLTEVLTDDRTNTMFANTIPPKDEVQRLVFIAKIVSDLGECFIVPEEIESNRLWTVAENAFGDHYPALQPDGRYFISEGWQSEKINHNTNDYYDGFYIEIEKINTAVWNLFDVKLPQYEQDYLLYSFRGEDARENVYYTEPYDDTAETRYILTKYTAIGDDIFYVEFGGDGWWLESYDPFEEDLLRMIVHKNNSTLGFQVVSVLMNRNIGQEAEMILLPELCTFLERHALHVDQELSKN